MHRYKVREIAQQAGLSEATVDRVLNDRPGVRENTRAEVLQAIADLDKQRAQLRLNGRRFLIDVVMQTPRRFSDAFRAAIEAELPAFAPAMLRARFRLWESGATDQMVDALARIRGSHGVVLKAPDQPEIVEAIDRLVAAGVTVVTYTTDVPHSSRCAYVGIDNHGAGATAAYLMDQWLGSAPSSVLITLSRTVFRGEGEREVGFRSGLRSSGRDIVEVSDSDGIDATTERLVLEALRRNPSVEAVYSPGGGNTATVAAFEKLGRVCRVYVAHDLDADNRTLLRDGKISVVLHNDLRADARLAMRLILAQHGALPVEPARPTPIQVITPYNLPP
ncbi:LacI family DNA-binding transcriptional regulator [Mycobacterium sp. 21AC1]|uniref:LacI family DNA-binding transcriptional regulator n=1 Tax=[Mycobacterium] appelbergii TaxID=2939269 RepID=UPI002938EB8E|nr:LacI family DNA-binding transcriptional regulator [Mycobacterium sp. 21AC1]MDV3128237.1 LacI family DNA-binding transcriptional regulator [Mycobacterium sp. 21AC1]